MPEGCATHYHLWASWRPDSYSFARRSLPGVERNSHPQFGHVGPVRQLTWGGSTAEATSYLSASSQGVAAQRRPRRTCPPAHRGWQRSGGHVVSIRQLTGGGSAPEATSYLPASSTGGGSAAEATSYLYASSTGGGRAAEEAAKRKAATYSALSSSHIFIPVVIEILSTINEVGEAFLVQVGKLLSTKSDDPKENFFLFQWISVIFQCFNELAFRGNVHRKAMPRWVAASDCFHTLFLTIGIFTTEGTTK